MFIQPMKAVANVSNLENHFQMQKKLKILSRGANFLPKRVARPSLVGFLLILYEWKSCILHKQVYYRIKHSFALECFPLSFHSFNFEKHALSIQTSKAATLPISAKGKFNFLGTVLRTIFFKLHQCQ